MQAATPPAPIADPYRLLVESLWDDALFLLDPGGRIATWNSGAELLTGYARAEVLGGPVGRLYHPDDATVGPTCDLWAALERGRRERELVLARRDGLAVRVRLTVTPVRDADRRGGFAVHLRAADRSAERRRERGGPSGGGGGRCRGRRLKYHRRVLPEARWLRGCPGVATPPRAASS